MLRVKDVARIELGAQSYDQFTTVDGKPTIGVAIFLQSGANALKVADSVRATMAEMSRTFPQGVSYMFPYDTTRVVQASIKEVIHTLLAAAVLVLIVVFVFLQSWRAALIPFIAVPVSLIGAFAGLFLFGFSINTLTLFAIVLATGIVVDDAIVVLENVERLMAERGLTPRQAAFESMTEVTTAIIAIELVLLAVFVPVAFLGGLAGQLYKQFAVTVATAVTISGVLALTLTPALCAILLKPSHEARLFHPFNVVFAWITAKYTKGVNRVIHHVWLSLAAFVLVIAAAAGLLKIIPGSLVPVEDSGYFYGAIVLPDGASLGRTGAVGASIQHTMVEHPSVEHVFVVNGFDLIGGGNKTNAATMFVTLKPWDERPESAADMVKYMSTKGAEYREGLVFAFNAPPIRGIGTAGGFEVYVQNRADADPKKLEAVVQQFVGELRKRKELTRINTFYRPSVPQLFVEVDRAKAIALGVPVSDVFDALQSTMGSLYVNDFNKFGRTYRVQIQADAPVPLAPGGPRQCLCALGGRRHDPGQGADPYPRHRRPRPARPFQRLHRRQGPGRLGAWGEFGPGHRRGGGGRGQGAAAGLLPRLDRAGIPGKAHRPGVDHRIHFRAGDGVPHPVGEIRALVAAGRGAAGGAVRAARRAAGDPRARHEQRHLFPDRPGDADRPGGEECNPDRRVRRPERGCRNGRDRCSHRGRAPALPAHRDDFARLHVRRAAAGARHRRRRGGAALDGHRRVRRHARRDLRRHPVRAAVLHAAGTAQGKARCGGCGRRRGLACEQGAAGRVLCRAAWRLRRSRTRL